MTEEAMNAVDEIVAMVADKLGVNRGDVVWRETVGTNGLRGIGIQKVPKTPKANGVETSPIFNITDKVNGVVDGVLREEDAAMKIAEQMNRYKKEFPEGLKLDRDYIMEKCRTKVVSAGRNIHMLSGCPYNKLCDLAEVVIVPVDIFGENEQGFITVDNRLIDMFGIDKDELFEAARKNLADSVVLRRMGDILGIIGEDNDTLYVVTTTDNCYGAAVIGCADKMRECIEKVGGDAFIIPSSVHEVLLCKKWGEAEANSIVDIIREVNRTVVSDNEYLSDRLYGMSDSGELEIVA